MELLSGETLHDRMLRERVLLWQNAVAIARAVCSSLAEAHALGVVHRDLKPGNLHVERRAGADFVKVIDFGIVKLVRGSAIDDGKELTFAGHMIGTCDYMSSEQIAGGPCDAASDIYSLGVVLYEMLTGRRPFARAQTPAALLTALLTLTPQPPSMFAAIPPALDRVVLRCLEREARHRFASIRELAAALDRARAGRAGRDRAHRGADLGRPTRGLFHARRRLWTRSPAVLDLGGRDGEVPRAAPRALGPHQLVGDQLAQRLRDLRGPRAERAVDVLGAAAGIVGDHGQELAAQRLDLVLRAAGAAGARGRRLRAGR
jgi:hypothetical protein